MKPLISVVIPTFNRPQLLRRCIKALLHQSLDHQYYELIIVTDGPDERTENAVKVLRERLQFEHLHCFALPEKRGPAAARNAGWQYSSGELVVFTDDDCIALYDLLEIYWKAFKPFRHQAVALTGTIKVPLQGTPTDYEKNVAQLEKARFVTANCACSRPALHDIGGLDEQFAMAWREDTALEFSLKQQNIPIYKVKSAWVLHPVRPPKWGVSIGEEKKNMYNALLEKKFPSFYEIEKITIPRHYYLHILLLVFAIWYPYVILSWLLVTLTFARKRLKGTSHSLEHIAEMIVTSALIPLVSVFWNFYGTVKFKIWQAR